MVRPWFGTSKKLPWRENTSKDRLLENHIVVVITMDAWKEPDCVSWEKLTEEALKGQDALVFTETKGK